MARNGFFGFPGVEPGAPQCANCGIPISWTPNPLMAGGNPYCCEGCANGGPCNCTYCDAPSQAGTQVFDAGLTS